MSDRGSEKVRVRFAPSPTGHLHVGGARTALYNWLFARANGGVFVLRIEDTDVSRSTEAAVEKIFAGMRWLGLDWDEGPDRGGAYGPYRQMERQERYDEAIGKLLHENLAYRCYCTPEEIDIERQEARKDGRPYVYGGKCRDLGLDDAAALGAEGKESVIRLRTEAGGYTVVNDLIRGQIEFENALQGDFIMVRSNGVATYNFAVAVDDTSMSVSHVIRGDDHLPNTPRQIMVMQALEGKVPAYAHLPLILGQDRSPLSKRHGSVSVGEFRSGGYLREAMNNYLALLGWSFDAETTLFSIDELVEKFSLERVSRTAAVFDSDKLLWMNGTYIREMDPDELAARIEEYIEDTGLSGLPGQNGHPAVERLVPLVQEKMKTLADFVELTDFFFLPIEYQEKALKKLKKDANAVTVLEAARSVLGEVESFSEDSLEDSIRAAAAEQEIKLGKFLQPLRIAVSGKMVTPGMFETLSVLGRERSLARIEDALALLEG